MALPDAVTAYLARIGYTGDTEPSLHTLQGLVAAHNGSIPFENLDPLTGVPVADLSVEALTDKLVNRRRGGYCYEHNGLLAYILESLGYQVHRLAARVVWMRQGHGDLPAQTHQALAVTTADQPHAYLVDVGFGGQTLTSAIRLEPTLVQPTRHEPYRLLEHPEGFELQARLEQRWEPLYVFSLRPQPRIDAEVGSWYVSTHPSSGFVTGLSASLVTDTERWNLRGRRLAVHRRGGTEKTRLESAEQVMDVLAGRFAIDLADLGDRGDLRARIEQVLDDD